MRDARPGDEAASIASRMAPSAEHGDAARDAIDAARARMIDRRGSVVTAEPDEECLLWRATDHFTKVCVPARAVSTTLASRRRRPYVRSTGDTANLEDELRRRESSLSL